jgi:HlyD family secretion protein
MNADVEVVIGRQEDVLALANSGVKTQAEAVRIVEALGLDVDIDELARLAQEGASGVSPTEAAKPAEDEEVLNGVPVSRLATMSQSDRMKWFEGLSAAERSRAMQLFQQQGGGRGSRNTRPGQPRPAFVFQYDATGALTVKPIMIGLGNFDYTQVISGLEEGEEVVSVPLSLIQQQDFLNRMRSRSALPGIGGAR